jgi:hypothetical protein
MAMKRSDPTIRLSKEKCAAIPCGKSGFKVKSDHRDFSLPLCHEHLVMKLAEWEAEDEAEEQRLKKQKAADKKAKEANGATAKS